MPLGNIKFRFSYDALIQDTFKEPESFGIFPPITVWSLSAPPYPPLAFPVAPPINRNDSENSRRAHVVNPRRLFRQEKRNQLPIQVKPGSHD